MLKENGAEFTYREYTKDVLTEAELRDLFAKLGTGPAALLRKRDANKAGLTGDESDDVLIAAMALNPRLLQRPIGIKGDRAVVGRPPLNLLALI